MRSTIVSGGLVVAALLLVGGAGVGRAAAAAPVPVPRGDYLVTRADSGRLLVISSSGKPLGAVPGTVGPYGAEGIALSADRRSAYVSMRMGDDQPPNLYRVDLATGSKQVVASGLAPALGPDGTKLAYIATALSSAGISTPTGLAVLDLRTGTTRLIPPETGSQPARGPRGPVNWSPDGRVIAVTDGARIRLVDVATAGDLGSQPPLPGDNPDHPIPARIYPPDPPPGTKPPAVAVPVVTVARPPAPTTANSLAPVFLDADTVVAVYDCCIGLSHLVAFDLRTGRRSAFATLYGPPENISRLGPGRLLVVTAARLLVSATRNHPLVVATGISAAGG